MTVQRTAEQRAAGSRTEGHFVTLGPRSNGAAELRKVKTLTAIDPTNLCSDCSWPNVCGGDAACWHDERRISGEVARYRRREQRGQLTGTEADVDPVGRPAGRTHGELDAVAQLLDEADRPIAIEVPEPLPAANQRLMDVLGVTVNVVETGPTELIEEESAAELRGRNDAATSSSTSSRAGVGPGKKWTEASAIAAIQAWALEHGHPPSSNDAKGDRSLPSAPTGQRLGGWAYLVEKAGFPRPTKATRYKDSSGSALARPATEESAEQPGEQEPEVAAAITASPAPLLAEVAQLEEHRPILAGDAGSTPALRSETPPRRVEPVPLRAAVLGVLDSLRVLVDAVMPEAPE